MTDDIKDNGPDLTIVGGQPKREKPKFGKVQVPVGLEKILYHAAGDDKFRQLLMRDRDAAIAASGVKLRDSEQAMLRIASDADLERMIDRIVPSNPRRRKFMGLVAAAAASLAAGTVLVQGGCDTQSKGVRPDGDAGTDTDSDTDTDVVDTETYSDSTDGHRGDWPDAGDTDTVDTDTNSDTDVLGIRSTTDVDGKF